MDTNGDGKISRDEFLAAWKTHSTHDLDGEDVFEDMDVDENGWITQVDFNIWYLHQTCNEMYLDFKKMDKQNNGKVCEKDFIECCHNLCPVSHAKNLFKMLDVNGDGVLSWKEFSEGTEKHYIVRTLNGYLNYGAVGHNETTMSTPPDIKKFHLIYKDGALQLNDSSVMEAFNQIDWQMTDRLLTLVEFQKYFSLQGVSEIDSKKLYDDFEKRSDGGINYADFKDYLMGPDGRK